MPPLLLLLPPLAALLFTRRLYRCDGMLTGLPLLPSPAAFASCRVTPILPRAQAGMKPLPLMPCVNTGKLTALQPSDRARVAWRRRSERPTQERDALLAETSAAAEPTAAALLPPLAAVLTLLMLAGRYASATILSLQ